MRQEDKRARRTATNRFRIRIPSQTTRLDPSGVTKNPCLPSNLWSPARWPMGEFCLHRVIILWPRETCCFTLGQNPTFYPEITKKLMFENVHFVKNEIFVKNDFLKMWILWKMRFWKCALCEKWDCQNVNFVKTETLKMWILSKNEILKIWIFG